MTFSAFCHATWISLLSWYVLIACLLDDAKWLVP